MLAVVEAGLVLAVEAVVVVVVVVLDHHQRTVVWWVDLDERSSEGLQSLEDCKGIQVLMQT